MTGWRIKEPLALPWDDVSLDQGFAITRAKDNKGRRDDQVPLHPIVVAHLRRIVDYGSMVFSWPRDKRSLYTDFVRIQAAASIQFPCSANHEHQKPCPPDCQKKHEHAQGCPPEHYGFHDLRRAFATMNADRLTGDALQALMRHKSYQTTQRYINIARQLNKAVDDLYVPDLAGKTPED